MWIQIAHKNSTAMLEQCFNTHLKNKLRGFGPLANYADRATAACWRSSANFCG
jgi:hypothetical protein